MVLLFRVFLLLTFSFIQTHSSPHITSVQYCGGCSVHWRLLSTLEVVQYIGGITSVLWGDSFSTVGGCFSTVEVVQYSGGIASVLWGDSFSTVGVASVLWRLFSTVGDNISTCGG